MNFIHKLFIRAPSANCWKVIQWIMYQYHFQGFELCSWPLFPLSCVCMHGHTPCRTCLCTTCHSLRMLQVASPFLSAQPFCKWQSHRQLHVSWILLLLCMWWHMISTLCSILYLIGIVTYNPLNMSKRKANFKLHKE